MHASVGDKTSTPQIIVPVEVDYRRHVRKLQATAEGCLNPNAVST
jgi:hypothetical protein